MTPTALLLRHKAVVSSATAALSPWTRSTRVVDRSADACFAWAKHERDLGSARRLDVVHSSRLTFNWRDAREQAKRAARVAVGTGLSPLYGTASTGLARVWQALDVELARRVALD
jgi:hypothetical protein